MLITDNKIYYNIVRMKLFNNKIFKKLLILIGIVLLILITIFFLTNDYTNISYNDLQYCLKNNIINRIDILVNKNNNLPYTLRMHTIYKQNWSIQLDNLTLINQLLSKHTNILVNFYSNDLLSISDIFRIIIFTTAVYQLSKLLQSNILKNNNTDYHNKNINKIKSKDLVGMGQYIDRFKNFYMTLDDPAKIEKYKKLNVEMQRGIYYMVLQAMEKPIWYLLLPMN